MIEHSKRIAALIYKHLQNKLSRQEKKELDEWIAASEKNALLFKKLTGKGIAEQAERDFDDGRLAAAAERISRRVGFEVKPYLQADRKAGLRRRARIRYLSAAAAVVAVLLVAGPWAYKASRPAAGKEISQQPIADSHRWGDKAVVTAGNGSDTITTPRGGMHLVQLPDDSKAWLNADSKIVFPTAFAGHERNVHLSGEAYFEVTGAANRPFVVSADDGTRVTVLGTHFSVRAYKGEAPKVRLLEGGVKVSKGNAARVLKPMEQAVVAGDGSIDVKPVADSLGAISWKNGIFSFDDAGISTFATEISRLYDIDVRYEGYFDWFHCTAPFPLTLTLDGLQHELAKPEYKLNVQLKDHTIWLRPQ